ncbi:Iron(3+)-hydroxamate import ATP-binding protein FhuC [Frankliniella fusca]|uniref:Iron(3+)-hydroxamate import ATP-binding protein FhuC n=1 Tax=Frankliniella fusca TaxID=407009 RepID=A0AAE1LU66_9NEOP|nr:Iron(3+)-hydroxamate import ATP-binding protein FhuC [Frankliniella fusca]
MVLKELYDLILMSERIRLRFATQTSHVIDPRVDNYKWYNLKKDKNMKLIPRLPLLPLIGWGQFPSRGFRERSREGDRRGAVPWELERTPKVSLCVPRCS